MPQAEIVEQHGTVAAETALAMATAARERTGADAGLGITGVAGPSEVEGKPVGTFYIALDFMGQTRVVRFALVDDAAGVEAPRGDGRAVLALAGARGAAKRRREQGVGGAGRA